MPRTGRPPRPYTKRFWNFVHPIPDTCWEWHGKRDKQGYGILYDASTPGKELRAHRVAYEIAHGPILPGFYVLHHCDQPSCVNVAHLFLGTPGDNLRDASQKQRLQTGDKHWSRRMPERISRKHANVRRAVLTVEHVRYVRAMQGQISAKDLGETLGLTPASIGRIWNRKQWKHIPESSKESL